MALSSGYTYLAVYLAPQWIKERGAAWSISFFFISIDSKNALNK